MTTQKHTNEGQALPNSSTEHNQQAQKQAKHSRSSSSRKTGQDIIPIPRACQKRIETWFDAIDYNDINRYNQDWQTIMPKTDHNALNRWQFAYCTVHTPWLRSCEQYDKIKHTTPATPYNKLLHMFKQTGGGMFNHKAEGVHNLHTHWTTNKKLFEPDTNNWQDWRDNLANSLKRLGLAKTSFAIEMVRPMDAQIICIDRHMFKAFGWENVDESCNPNQYRYYEDYWLELSKSAGVAPVISRNLFWDQIQQQNSSMYWANYLLN